MKNKLLIGVLLLVLIAYLGFETSATSLVFVFPIADIFYLLTSFLAVLGGIYAFIAYGWRNPHAKSILLITVAIGCLFMGELLWSVFETILDIDPFPSSADFFYLISYPILFLGLLNEFRLSNTKMRDVTKKMSVTLIIVVPALVALVTYFGIYLAYDSEVALIENIIVIAYGIGDLILVILSIPIIQVAAEYKGGKLAMPWIYFLCGLLFMLIADIAFAIFTEPYEEGVLLYQVVMNFFWAGSFLLFTYSLVFLGGLIRGVAARAALLTKTQRKA